MRETRQRVSYTQRFDLEPSPLKVTVMNSSMNRRRFIQTSAAAATVAAVSPNVALAESKSQMQIGLVTYLWGQDWDLETLLRNCEKTKVLGLELRTQHKHGVETKLNAKQRSEVKKRFADSPVTLLGPGCNWEFHSPNPADVKRNIQGAKDYAQLSHDTGGSGVKVKPNTLPKGVPVEKTIEQIGKSLDEVGKFAADLGQEVRVEVHGRETQKLPIMKRIFDHVDQKNVGVCWNSNNTDLIGEGLEHNFNLVKDRFGATCHVRELNVGNYPYAKLIKLLVQAKYKGWVLLECRTKPKDRIAALVEQREVFEKMVKASS